jgi:hypothetical protein
MPKKASCRDIIVQPVLLMYMRTLSKSMDDGARYFSTLLHLPKTRYLSIIATPHYSRRKLNRHLQGLTQS